ncbi:MAG: hypothetical protein WBE72_05400 [Terracidiphilus sp.]
MLTKKSIGMVLSVLNQGLLQVSDSAARIFHVSLVTGYQMDVKMLDSLACCLALVDSDIESVDVLLRRKHFFGILQNATEAEQLLVPQLRKPRDMTFGNQQCVAGVDGKLIFDREEPLVFDQDGSVPTVCQRTEQTAFHPLISARTSLCITHSFDPKVLIRDYRSMVAGSHPGLNRTNFPQEISLSLFPSNSLCPWPTASCRGLEAIGGIELRDGLY